MGLTWLDGKNWVQVTREERWFCLHLYNRIVGKGVRKFVAHLRDQYEISVEPDANWELAYEACFYRDLWQYRNRQGSLYSPKRTFDLALFSDEAIIVLEAKAHGAFERAQLDSFSEDRNQIRRETGVDNVLILGLCSSKHELSKAAKECFDKVVRWKDLSSYFDGDVNLQRADNVFEQTGFGSFGQNNLGGHMKGEDLLSAFDRGERFSVGRNGGLHGKRFSADVASGEWKTREYETNRDSPPSNRNWFSLEDFVDRVRRDGES